MSLLNDMLRDLSHPQKDPDAPESISQTQQHDQFESNYSSPSLLHSSGVLKAAPVNIWPSVLVFFVALIALIVWRDNSVSTPTQEASPLTKFDVKQEPAEQVLTEKLPIKKSAVEQSELEKTATEKVAAEKIAVVVPVETLPQRYEGLPENIDGNNQETQHVELLNSRLAELEQAITTLSGIVQQASVEQAGAINIPNDADDFRVDQDELVPEASLDSENYVDKEDDVSAAESVSIRDPFESAPNLESLESAQELTQAQTPTATGEAHLAITLNPNFTDQRQAQTARELFLQGQVERATKQLKAFIASADVNSESTVALLDIFVEQQNAQAIAETLNKSNALGEVDRQFYLAKSAVIQQNEAHAIELLETQLTAAEDHENYRALLAGLYQRTGKFSEAALAYRRLLTRFGDKPAYWLGFALAQDSLNQTQTAKQAYQRLAQYTGLQPEVRDYIQQRLTALQ